jgi:hypothetical protein
MIYPPIFRGEDQNIAFRKVERKPASSRALIPHNMYPVAAMADSMPPVHHQEIPQDPQVQPDAGQRDRDPCEQGGALSLCMIRELISAPRYLSTSTIKPIYITGEMKSQLGLT